MATTKGKAPMGKKNAGGKKTTAAKTTRTTARKSPTTTARKTKAPARGRGAATA